MARPGCAWVAVLGARGFGTELLTLSLEADALCLALSGGNWPPCGPHVPRPRRCAAWGGIAWFIVHAALPFVSPETKAGCTGAADVVLSRISDWSCNPGMMGMGTDASKNKSGDPGDPCHWFRHLAAALG